MPRRARREAHTELERQVVVNLPRILPEPFQVPLRAAAERPRVALHIRGVVAEQRVGVGMVGVERVLRRGRAGRGEVETPGETGGAETLAVDVVLVVEAGLHEMPRRRSTSCCSGRLQRRSMASMGNRASHATFGAIPGTPVKVNCGYRSSWLRVGVWYSEPSAPNPLGSRWSFEIGSGRRVDGGDFRACCDSRTRSR